MDAARKLGGERCVDHAVALDPALTLEGLCHDMNAEMRFTFRTVSGVTGVQMRFVNDTEALRMESLGQLFGDQIACPHAPPAGLRVVCSIVERNLLRLSSLAGAQARLT